MTAAYYPTTTQATKDYAEEYKIQLCNTLETKSEIRVCLNQSAEEYNKKEAQLGMTIGVIVLVVCVGFGFLWFENRYKL